MRHQINDRIFWFSCLAIAFFLPVFGKIVPAFIVIMTVNWLFDGRFITNFKNLFREKRRGWTISFASLYLLYFAGLLYTTNFDYGWFDLEVKFSLFIFPVIFATSAWPLLSLQQTTNVFRSFVAGCVAGALIILGHAAVNANFLQIPASFFYIKLAWYFHPSYLSMYYNFALGILLFHFLTGNDRRSMKGAATAGLILFLIAMIFLLGSKAGILTMFLVLFLSAIFVWFRLKQRWAGLAIIGTGAIVFLLGYWLVPEAFSRFSSAEHVVVSQEQVSRVTAESNSDRMAVWSTAIEIVKGNFFFGVGTGDVKDALMDGYRVHHFLPALEHKFNAHSQYLQTFVTLGITGFLILVFILLFPAIGAWRGRYYLYLVFLLIFAVNILVESMLEIQAGVVFYAFFNIFLFTSNRNGDPVTRTPV